MSEQNQGVTPAIKDEEKPSFNAASFLTQETVTPPTPPADPPKEEKPAETAATTEPPVNTPPSTDPPADPPKEKFQMEMEPETFHSLLETLDLTEKKDSLTLGDIQGRVDGYKKEVERMQDLLIANNSFENEKIKELNTLKGADAETVVKHELKQQGFTDDEINDQIAIYKDNETLDKQGELYKKRYDGAIEKEKETLKTDFQAKLEAERKKAAGVAEPEQIAKNVQLFNEALKDVDGYFGVKFGKDQASSEQAKQEFIKELANGEAAKQLLANPQIFAEALFHIKNRNVVEKVLHEKGLNVGKAIVISQLKNIEKPSQTGAAQTVVDGEFNPATFITGK